MTALRNLQKRKVFDELLQQGITALHLDARRPDVMVPPHLADQAWLVLNYSWRYGVHDFRFDDEAVEASLSFGGRPYFCRVPWSAVFAVTDTSRNQGYIWNDEVPGEVAPAAAAPTAPKPRTARAIKAKAAAPAVPAAEVPAEAPPARPGLRAIAGGSDGATTTPPRAGHLRRVK
ncbi:MAG: hypothetical protein HY902_01355 [Deltaproteobacteria bacterium]|nr:hypothetical protein [Deltaproteobacteria bacterium]